MREEFEQLKQATNLEAMELDQLVAFNTRLSNLREEAGGALRKEIYRYALEVNVFISRRAKEKAEARNRTKTSEQLKLDQLVTTKSFSGELEKLLRSKMA